jgi:hypothetical protein
MLSGRLSGCSERHYPVSTLSCLCQLRTNQPCIRRVYRVCAYAARMTPARVLLVAEEATELEDTRVTEGRAAVTLATGALETEAGAVTTTGTFSSPGSETLGTVGIRGGCWTGAAVVGRGAGTMTLTGTLGVGKAGGVTTGGREGRTGGMAEGSIGGRTGVGIGGGTGAEGVACGGVGMIAEIISGRPGRLGTGIAEGKTSSKILEMMPPPGAGAGGGAGEGGGDCTGGGGGGPAEGVGRMSPRMLVTGATIGGPGIILSRTSPRPGRPGGGRGTGTAMSLGPGAATSLVTGAGGRIAEVIPPTTSPRPPVIPSRRPPLRVVVGTGAGEVIGAGAGTGAGSASTGGLGTSGEGVGFASPSSEEAEGGGLSDCGSRVGIVGSSGLDTSWVGSAGLGEPRGSVSGLGFTSSMGLLGDGASGLGLVSASLVGPSGDELSVSPPGGLAIGFSSSSSSLGPVWRLFKVISTGLLRPMTVEAKH